MSTPAERAVPGPLNPLLEEGRDYPFVRLERRAAELAPAGLPVIRFSAGDPREETPAFIREALARAIPAVSSYPAVAGQPELRAACARWAARRFGAVIDPETELLPVNGSKEAVFLLAFAVVGRDRAAGRDTIVIPSPAYPVYEASAMLAGARVHRVPLSSANGWRFDPTQVPAEVWARTALLWLNTPHNPTGAVLDRGQLAAVASLARREGFWVASDEAYAEVYFDAAPPSMLECGSANVIAFHTLSKRSAMTGYRSGFMAGDPRLIAALRRMRPNVGVATPDFVQAAAIAAWNDDRHAADQRARYAAKRVLLRDWFDRHGLRIEASEATFYLWVRAPSDAGDVPDDVAFVDRLLRLGLVALPGSYLGAGGEGYLRWALVPTLAQCREAIARLDAAGVGARTGVAPRGAGA
ncbi:MAG TPA: aminotransferase class I/II-fold pyridoxal phosphate-dependent enzyme [Candidatus Eisenbacteria bacterium]